MVIDVKPATTLTEAADQMEEAVGMCADHYVNVCDVVLSNWSILCRSVDVDALLKLADEIELDGAGSLDDDDWCKPLLVEYAQRIRDALGVDDG